MKNNETTEDITCPHCYKSIIDNPIEFTQKKGFILATHYCPHCSRHFEKEDTVTDFKNITDEHIVGCLEPDTPEHWEVYKVYNESHHQGQGVKIRRKYKEDEIDFNEDGYKYELRHIDLDRTAHYKYLLKKGYNV